MAGELDPRTRKEVFLAGMLYGDPDDLPDPETRDELYMKAIGEAIKAGGLPDPSEASEGDVLAIGADGPEWAAPSGGAELWQHQVVITPVSTTLSDLNNKDLTCMFLSNSAEFTLETGPRQYASHVGVNDSSIGNVTVLNQGNADGSIIIYYGNVATGNIKPSGSGSRYTVSYGNHMKII